MDDKQRNELSGNIASWIGAALRQTYERHNGEWWLFTAGKPARQLKPDEIEWHVERKHKPFVPDGIDKDDHRWWDDPHNKHYVPETSKSSREFVNHEQGTHSDHAAQR